MVAWPGHTLSFHGTCIQNDLRTNERGVCVCVRVCVCDPSGTFHSHPSRRRSSAKKTSRDEKTRFADMADAFAPAGIIETTILWSHKRPTPRKDRATSSKFGMRVIQLSSSALEIHTAALSTIRYTRKTKACIVHEQNNR